MRLKYRIPKIVEEVTNHPYWGLCRYNRKQGSFLEKCFYELAVESEAAGIKPGTDEWIKHQAYMALYLKRSGLRVTYFFSALSDVVSVIKEYFGVKRRHTRDFWTIREKEEIAKRMTMSVALRELRCYLLVYLDNVFR